MALIPGDFNYSGPTVPGPVQWEGGDSLCEAGWFGNSFLLWLVLKELQEWDREGEEGEKPSHHAAPK